MSFTSPPSASSRLSHHPGDDLDGLLCDFYHAEMPRPWPELEPPGIIALPPTRLALWRRIKRSHVALAASVALLVGGSLMFSDKAPLYQVKPSVVDADPDIATKQNERLIDPEKVSSKESILLTPDGAAFQIELEENRY